MKKIISILAFTSLLCCSCDYLDVVPEGKATEEDIWKTTEQADKFRYYLQTYMPNLIGYDWSPDQFAGDDFITGARGTTYYFSSKSLLYNEETSSNTYFGRWEPSSVSGVPMSLLKFSGVFSTRYLASSTAAIISLVVVLPTEPVICTKGMGNRSR